MFGFKIWKVTGASMEPVLPSGCFAVAAKWLTFFSIKEGQRLIIEHPKLGVIVKTVAMVDRNGFIWTKGENKESLSVEKLGPVDKRQILGRVIKVSKPEKSKKEE